MKVNRARLGGLEQAKLGVVMHAKRVLQHATHHCCAATCTILFFARKARRRGAFPSFASEEALCSAKWAGEEDSHWGPCPVRWASWKTLGSRTLFTNVSCLWSMPSSHCTSDWTRDLALEIVQTWSRPAAFISHLSWCQQTDKNILARKCFLPRKINVTQCLILCKVEGSVIQACMLMVLPSNGCRIMSDPS